MKISGNTLRIGIATAVILGTVAWLAFTGYGAGKQYLVHISELGGMGDKAYSRQLRVDGFVIPGSIEHDGPHVTFMMNEFESHSPKAPEGRLLKVVYKGSEPPPDTFKDDAQAVRQAHTGATGSSTRPNSRPSAPANMRRQVQISRAQSRRWPRLPSRMPLLLPPETPTRLPPNRLPEDELRRCRNGGSNALHVCPS